MLTGYNTSSDHPGRREESPVNGKQGNRLPGERKTDDERRVFYFNLLRGV
jgi:hypothetical protein